MGADGQVDEEVVMMGADGQVDEEVMMGANGQVGVGGDDGC